MNDITKDINNLIIDDSNKSKIKKIKKINKNNIDIHNEISQNSKKMETILKGITGININSNKNKEYIDLINMIKKFENYPELTLLPTSSNPEHKEFLDFCKLKAEKYKEEICFDINDISYDDLKEKDRKKILKINKIMQKINKYIMNDKFDKNFYCYFFKLLLSIKDFIDIYFNL